MQNISYKFSSSELPPPTNLAKTTTRLEARIPHELHALLKYAANLEGRSMTDFVITSIRKAAEESIERAAIIHLTLEDQKLFTETLASPPVPNEALKKAFAQHQRLVQDD